MADTPAPKSPATRRPSGKQRAIRIPLDYYKTPDALGRWRAILVLLAPTIALGWWFGDHLLRGDRAEIRVSHGPLWSGHAMWENNCEVCHVPFEPIKSEAAFAERGSSRLAGSDQRCSSCHEGPIHHANQLAEKTESCGGCHQDHEGPEADLNRVPDAQCTICHAELPLAIQGGPSEDGIGFLNVARFDNDHPDFAIRAVEQDGLGELIGRLTPDGATTSDPSNLKFNHAMHLSEGIDCGFTFADLAPADRARFGWTDRVPLETPVRLDCSSCHTLDGSDSSPASEGLLNPSPVPPRSDGAYMLPISFENHCQACHPLTVGSPETDRPPPGGPSPSPAGRSSTLPEAKHCCRTP